MVQPRAGVKLSIQYNDTHLLSNNARPTRGTRCSPLPSRGHAHPDIAWEEGDSAPGSQPGG